MVKIKGRFDWQTPSIVPAFISGEDAEAIYEKVKDSKLGWCDYDVQSKTMRGSNPFIASRIDTELRPLGIRVANVRDLSRPEVMRMVEGKYYTDSPTLVVQSMKDSYERNLPLIKRLAEEVESRNGKVEFPFMVYGYDSAFWPEDEKGYKVNIVARDDFTYVHDNRLKRNGEKFRDVDELGLPKFDKNGNRTFYTRSEGLSRFYLDWDLDLRTNNDNLADSIVDGRVVLLK